MMRKMRNPALNLAPLSRSSEVWIHVVGVIAFMMGVYAWVAAKHENKPFLEASVYTRFVVFVALTTFAVIGLASPMIVFFGVADLLGGIWTHFALKADAQSVRPILAGQDRPDPSIEGTPTSGLRPLAAAPHVKP
jgi:hypothetical protein